MRAPERKKHLAKEGIRWVPPCKEWLWDQYVTRSKSARQISREVGAHVHTVLKWIHRMDIPIRSK